MDERIMQNKESVAVFRTGRKKMIRSIFFLLLYIALCVNLCGCQDDIHKNDVEHTIDESNVSKSSDESDIVENNNLSIKVSSEIEEDEGIQTIEMGSEIQENDTVGNDNLSIKVSSKIEENDNLSSKTSSGIDGIQSSETSLEIEENKDVLGNMVPEQNYSTEEHVIEGCYDDPENPVARQNYSVGEPKYE